MTSKPEGFCTKCGFVIQTFDGLCECPACGTTGVPCHNDNQVTVTINTHELRILCMWSERYAGTCDQKDNRDGEETLLPVVYSIAARLSKQLPTPVPLTLAGEMQELSDAFGAKVEHTFPGIPQPKSEEPS